jgi:hypothetical protein
MRFMKSIISIIGIYSACIVSLCVNAQEPLEIPGFNKVQVPGYFFSGKYSGSVPVKPVPVQENSSLAFIVGHYSCLVHTASQVAGSIQFILFHENNDEEKEKNLTGPGEVDMSAFNSPFKALDGFIFGTGPVYLLEGETDESGDVQEEGIAQVIMGLEKNNAAIAGLVVSSLFSEDVNSDIVHPGPAQQAQAAGLRNVINRERH